MIITSAGQKGGPGKSMIAQNLAAYLLQKTDSVLLVDSDKQQHTTHDWIQDRIENENLPDIECAIYAGNLISQLDAWRTKYEYVVVDCAGIDSISLRSALASADIALVTFRPKQRDLRTLPHMAEVLELAIANNPKLKVCGILNQCPTQPNQRYRIEGAKGALAEFDIPVCEQVLYSRNIYDDIEENGCSVVEQTYDKKAREEILNAFEQILRV